MSKENLRAVVRGTYDMQKLRIQTGNRIVANFKVKLGQEPTTKESELDKIAKEILRTIRTSYDKITEGLVKSPTRKKFSGDAIISDYTEFCLVDQWIRLEKEEKVHVSKYANILKDYPIWTEYLEGVRGVGPMMAGVIISEIDIHKARYCSSLQKYVGIDVVTDVDGLGRSRRKEHLIDREYTTKDGKIEIKKSITFNPFLKAKLLGVLVPSFLKSGNEKYSKIYYDYKHRMENHERWGKHNDDEKDENGKKFTGKGRRHNQAMRRALKYFLIDLYIVWRKMEGLTVHEPYEVAKLGINHHGGN